MPKMNLETYRNKKKNRDRRRFHRIYNTESPTFIFYLTKLPGTLVKALIQVIRKQDVSRPFYDLINIAKIRKQIMFYKRKKANESEKVYFKYYIGEHYIEVRVLFGRKMPESEYEQLIQVCGTTTQMHHSVLSRKDGYYTFCLYHDPIPQKCIVVDEEKHEICVGQDYQGAVMWDFDIHSCALIAGKPRNGKSSVIMYLLNSLVQADWDIWLIDGKDVDYIAYIDYFTEYVGNDDLSQVIELIERFHQQMVNRYGLMHDHRVNKYVKMGLEPKFLICDEYLSVIERIRKECTKAQYEKVIYMVGDIVRRGPAGGIQLVLGMQRADTVYIPGEMRSNMQCKIVVGDGGNDLYKMMFEDESDICVPVEIGHAWYRMGSAPRTMAVPLYETIEVVKEHEAAEHV